MEGLTNIHKAKYGARLPLQDESSTDTDSTPTTSTATIMTVTCGSESEPTLMAAQKAAPEAQRKPTSSLGDCLQTLISKYTKSPLTGGIDAPTPLTQGHIGDGLPLAIPYQLNPEDV